MENWKSDNKDIEDVRGLIREAKEIKKLAPPIIAFRAVATTTTTAAHPGTKIMLTNIVIIVALVVFRDIIYNYGNGYSDGVFTAPLHGLYTFYAQMRPNVG